MYTARTVFSRWIDTRWRLLSVGSALFLTSCQIDFSGLNSLLDSTATFLSLPGSKISNILGGTLIVDGTDQGGAFLLGMDQTQPTQRLAIVPFAGGVGLS